MKKLFNKIKNFFFYSVWGKDAFILAISSDVYKKGDTFSMMRPEDGQEHNLLVLKNRGKLGDTCFSELIVKIIK